jgi:hypothetical protein
LPVRVIRRPACLAALAPCYFIVLLASRQGSRRSGINPTLFLSRLQLPPSGLPVPAPALLAILGLASVSVHTSAALGHPGRNSPPLFSAGFLRYGNLEISTPIRPFNRGSRLFSLFESLILGQADASFQLVSELLILPFTRQLHVKMRCPSSYPQADLA